MTDQTSAGLTSWKRGGNHNHLIDIQKSPLAGRTANCVEVSYFGASAFRCVSPEGLSILIDPWRNHPSGASDWFFCDFPDLSVDIGMSTHAHFDHDGLHMLNASMLLDRMVGEFRLADVKITGIADKHRLASPGGSLYDWCRLHSLISGERLDPTQNARGFDNVMYLVETGGLRILHWGDNRNDLPGDVWAMLGSVDVLLLPIDESWHILNEDDIERIIDRLEAKIVIPHHYYIWDLISKSSTLLPAFNWVERRASFEHLNAPAVRLDSKAVRRHQGHVLHFGDNVAFGKPEFAATSDERPSSWDLVR
ncbi:MAG: MBL fold metallo-hydrolase [Roseovarius sp.]|nr:MBL fold metallo-hydrolase [Roseovarius sp.]MCY4207822.1 MBL fold metallo-hydrolase [Roseovarius sp.]MCY4292799.1 MBL fold metallo-hydrolase [Roseovarius sp.]MCY4316718.1 MBL fold metallo-hydrolase [Roseovarius sp.]